MPQPRAGVRRPPGRSAAGAAVERPCGGGPSCTAAPGEGAAVQARPARGNLGRQGGRQARQGSGGGEGRSVPTPLGWLAWATGRGTPDGGPPAGTAGHPTPTTCPLECAARGASRATPARPALARAPASRPARSAGPPHAGGRGGGARGAASRPASCCRLPVSESLSQPTKKPTRARTRGAVRGVADVQRCLPTISCTRS